MPILQRSECDGLNPLTVRVKTIPFSIHVAYDRKPSQWTYKAYDQDSTDCA